MGKALAAPASGPSPQGMYGIYSKLRVTIDGQSSAKSSDRTLAGRIESHLERTVEHLSSEDFLKKIKEVLQAMGMRGVLAINRNDVFIFNHDDGESVDWDEAFEVATNAATSVKGADSWWILVSGSNGDFKFRQDVTFKRKHSLASPSMEIVIRALPAEWAPQPTESSNTWKSRLGQTLHDKKAVKSEETLVRPRIESYLQRYQQLLVTTFGGAVSQEVRIELSKIDLGSFQENYSTEQV